MTSRVFRVLEIESLQQGESVIDMTPDNIAENKSNQQFNSYLQMTQLPQVFSSWTPSEKFYTIKNKFENK